MGAWTGLLALWRVAVEKLFLTPMISTTAYSPRLVLWISRDASCGTSLGVFTAIFLYAVVVLA